MGQFGVRHEVEHHVERASRDLLLAAELERPSLGSDALVPALLDTLLLYLLRTWFTEPTNVTGWAAALSDPVVATDLHAIHRDPAHPWTVAKLAAEAGLSRAPFAKAARILRDSDAPVNAVATKVGYTSEFAFAAAFKRVGTAPARYRRQSSAM